MYVNVPGEASVKLGKIAGYLRLTVLLPWQLASECIVAS